MQSNIAFVYITAFGNTNVAGHGPLLVSFRYFILASDNTLVTPSAVDRTIDVTYDTSEHDIRSLMLNEIRQFSGDSSVKLVLVTSG